MFYQMLTTERKQDEVNGYASEYIDVRDVADAFVKALKSETAGGERFILDAGAFTLQNLCMSMLPSISLLHYITH